MWIPDGHSIWNDGIHMESILFHVDSRWDGMTKMARIPPKTYSIWNRWNPSGMTWIPDGFHVECLGRVKTIRLKDQKTKQLSKARSPLLLKDLLELLTTFTNFEKTFMHEFGNYKPKME